MNNLNNIIKFISNNFDLIVLGIIFIIIFEYLFIKFIM